MDNYTDVYSTNNVSGCELPPSMTDAQRCAFIQTNDALCEGGGYLLYTVIVMCEPTIAYRIITIVAFILLLFYYFVAISASADGFLSPNIVAIVDHLKISQNIAGVTFLAFGNGAPDVFTSLAAVLGSSSPKAGLAYGALLGAGIFDTTVVVAAIVLIKPFHVMRRPIIRDIGVYFIAIVWTLITFVATPWILWWETIVFLFIYVVYALVVIIGRIVHQRQRRAIKHEQQLQEHRCSTQLQLQSIQIRSISIGSSDRTIDNHVLASVDKKESVADKIITKDKSFLALAELAPNTSHNSDEDDDGGQTQWHYDDSVISEPDQSDPSTITTESDPDAITNTTTPVATTKKDIRKEIRTRFVWELNNFLSATKPISHAKWISVNLFLRIFYAIRIPIVIAMKLTIPLTKNQWSKALAILQCYSCPLFAAFAIQQLVTSPVPGWAIALAIGVLPSFAIVICTDSMLEPKYFRTIASYCGFIMSIAWIYLLSNEIVGVLTMIGVISGISELILGLTLLAWSNSLGDFVADTAVARRGFPCIGISAAFGGPLFNLLIGFGIPFTIATARDGPIDIIFDPVSKVLLIFLAASLISSIVLLPMQRFYARRPYAIYLIVLYVTFLVIAILAAARIIDF